MVTRRLSDCSHLPKRAFLHHPTTFASTQVAGGLSREPDSGRRARVHHSARLQREHNITEPPRRQPNTRKQKTIRSDKRMNNVVNKAIRVRTCGKSVRRVVWKLQHCNHRGQLDVHCVRAANLSRAVTIAGPIGRTCRTSWPSASFAVRHFTSSGVSRSVHSLGVIPKT